LLSPRERLQKAVRREQPDRVPLDLGGSATGIESVPYKDLLRYFELPAENITCFVREHAEPHEELLQKLSVDTRYLRIRPPHNYSREILPDNSYYDEWGIRWRKPPSSFYWDPVEHPFGGTASPAAVRRHNWPVIKDPGRTAGLREKARQLYETTPYALVADAPMNGVFETCLLLRGYQAFLEDLIANRHFAFTLLEKVTGLLIELYQYYLEAIGPYVDVVMTTDDLGMQQSLLISPQMYREMIKPFQKEFFAAIKQKTKAALFLHSCGAIRPLIPDLIEIGVDIINPVQPTAKNMDTAELKAEFGRHITFWGAVDSQRTLVKGSPEDVAAEVRRRLRDLAPGGGYVLCASHNIQPGVSPQNIAAIYETANRFGWYDR